jgi:hypothetical protein
MHTNLLVLSAAGLLLATGGAHANPDVIDRAYLASVAAQADARLANSGVQLPGVLRVTGELSGERLSGVRFATTGDLATDRAVDAALRKMPIAQVPAELSGRTVTLTLRPAPVVVAQTR